FGDQSDWVTDITNAGGTPAEFPMNSVVLEDHLPLNIGSPAVTSSSEDVTCSIDDENILTCTATGVEGFILSGGASLTITLEGVQPSTFGDGTLVNPRAGGVCIVDPELVLEESNLGNNGCVDQVDMVAPDLTATKSIQFGADIGPGGQFGWVITVENTGESEAMFGAEDEILRDTLPDGATYNLITEVPEPGVVCEIDDAN